MISHYNIEWLTSRFESGEALKFIYFWGHTGKHNDQVGKSCLSQWFQSPFTVNNLTYLTAEHWMMAHKALLFGDTISFDKIINATKPGEAKELGRQVMGYDEQLWNEQRVEIVKLGNIHKFNQHPELARYLLKTDDRVLVEASPVDTIWGIGLSEEDDDLQNIYAWRGPNLLGFALMEVRDFLREFGHFKSLDRSVQPPWLKYPGVDSHDMFWRMGKGEEHLMAFGKYYMSLGGREKTIYQLTNPAPHDWRVFYD